MDRVAARRPAGALSPPLVLALLWVAAGAAFASSGGSFDLSRFTVDGGGGEGSVGGAFLLGGTIGQPDAGLLSAGAFDLTGGFRITGAVVPPPTPTPTVTPTPLPPSPTPTPVPPTATPSPSPTRDPAAVQNLVVHFYNTVLGRDPEPGAVDAWEQGYFNYAVSFDIDVRFIPREIGRLFFLSEEYGTRNRSDAEFITDCYETFLYRKPSQTELDNWTRGVWNRGEAMTIFAESAEFETLILSLFPGMSGDATRNLVTTMYIGLLDRLVDQAGLEYATWAFDTAYLWGRIEGIRAQAKQ
ncbi:MAG TPA: DUF4214 domain-containing protein, partial [Sumerlaeia bacterium]|nr:DUF4214 domain-containing protein [Sumerlaeia bacterium]